MDQAPHVARICCHVTRGRIERRAVQRPSGLAGALPGHMSEEATRFTIKVGNASSQFITCSHILRDLHADALRSECIDRDREEEKVDQGAVHRRHGCGVS